MKIVKKDLKQGNVKVRAENLDDLWNLYNIIQRNDLVSGETERKIKIGGDNDRNAKVVRKKVFLKIKVIDTEFSKHSTVLRVQGIIVSGPDDISFGSHHTINVEPSSEIEIHKDWKKYELDKLKRAEKSTGKNTLIVVFDREDALFAKLTASGVEKISEMKGTVAKKDQDVKAEGNFWKEIVSKVVELDSRMKPKHVVFGSPGFWKDYVMKELPPALSKKAVTAACSSVTMPGVLEVVRRPELKAALEDEQAAKDETVVEQLLVEMGNEKASIGLDEVNESVHSGKCKELIISENLIHELRQEDKFLKVEALMKVAEQSGSKVHLIGTKDAAKKLDGIGGLASLDRW